MSFINSLRSRWSGDYCICEFRRKDHPGRRILSCTVLPRRTCDRYKHNSQVSGGGPQRVNKYTVPWLSTEDSLALSFKNFLAITIPLLSEERQPSVCSTEGTGSRGRDVVCVRESTRDHSLGWKLWAHHLTSSRSELSPEVIPMNLSAEMERTIEDRAGSLAWGSMSIADTFSGACGADCAESIP